jgi:acetyltransferase
MSENLNSFFNAKSIAIIGASNNRSKVGNVIFRKLKNQKGVRIPINPHEEVIENKKCYKRVKDYDKGIDLAVICIPSKKVPRILKECGKKGIKNVIIISSGFAETGKTRLQEKLSKIGLKYGLNVLGPNSFGIINPKKNIDITFSSQNFRKGDTVFLSQSGGLASYIIDNGFGLRAFVSLGNMIGLDFSDWIEYFEGDKKVKRIICFIEKLNDGKRFVEVCGKSSKKITVVMGGKTESGKKITSLHTGSVSSDHGIYSGAFRQAGVTESISLIRAFGLREEHIVYSLKGKKVFIISNSGGAAALLVDELSGKDYEVEVENLKGTANEVDYKKALNHVGRLKVDYDSIIVVLTPQAMSDPLKVAHEIIGSKLKDRIVACFLGRDSVEKALDVLRKESISVITMAV